MSASRWSMPGGAGRAASPGDWWRSPRRRRNSSSVWRPVSSTATIGWRARSGAVSSSSRAAPAWTIMTLRLCAMTSRRSVAIRARSAATADRVCRSWSADRRSARCSSSAARVPRRRRVKATSVTAAPITITKIAPPVSTRSSVSAMTTSVAQPIAAPAIAWLAWSWAPTTQNVTSRATSPVASLPKAFGSMNEAPICTANANTGAANGSRRRSSNGNVHSAVARLTASGGPGRSATQTSTCWTTASAITSASSACRLSHGCDLIVRSGMEGSSRRSSRRLAGCARVGARVPATGCLELERQERAHAEAATGPGTHLEPAAVEGDPLAHADQAVPAVLLARCPRAVVADLEPQRLGLVDDGDPCGRGAGVFERVRERFLHDAISRKLNARRQRLGFAVDDEVRWKAGPPQLLGERREVGQARLGCECGRALWLVLHDADQATHVGQRLVAGLLDDQQRLAGAARVAVEQKARGSALDGHHRHAVRDHVLPGGGDPGALRRDGGARALLPLAFEPVGALLQRGRALRSCAQREGAQRQPDGDQRPDEQAQLGVAGAHDTAAASRREHDHDGRQTDRGAGDRRLAFALCAGAPEGEHEREQRQARPAIHGGRAHERYEREPGGQGRRGAERKAAAPQQRHRGHERGDDRGGARAVARARRQVELSGERECECERLDGVPLQQR